MKKILLFMLLMMIPSVLATDKIIGVTVSVNTTGTGATNIYVEGGNEWMFNCNTNFTTSQNITKIINVDDNSTNVCNEKMSDINAYCKDFLIAFNRTYDLSIGAVFNLSQCQANLNYSQSKLNDLVNSSDSVTKLEICNAQLTANQGVYNDCKSQKSKLEESVSNKNVQIGIGAIVGAVVCYFFVRKQKPRAESEDINQY